jgi:hypothetical protein
MGINEIVANLYIAKQQEQAAKERRVMFEAELAKAIALPDEWEGTKTKAVGEFKVKLTRRMNYKIDANKLREQARVYNILPMLDKLFSWKPEVVRTEWKEADEKTRLAFAPAMEVTPGKASFTVEKTEEED